METPKSKFTPAAEATLPLKPLALPTNNPSSLGISVVLSCLRYQYRCRRGEQPFAWLSS